MDFPVQDFRRLISLGFYPSDTRARPVLGGSRPEPGLSADSLQRLRLDPTLQAVSRAFDPGSRHALIRPHWLVWMGCEVGMKRLESGAFVFHDPENLFPMSDIEAAHYYNYTIKTTQRYLRQARTAVLDEYYASLFNGERARDE